MAPKFKGGSDDWLDDEDSSSGRGPAPKKKSSQSKAVFISPSKGNATVAEIHPKKSRVLSDDGSAMLCSYRRATVIGGRGSDWIERSPVAVGDRVSVERTDTEEGVITGVCERRNRIFRPAPGRDAKNIHVLAANLDFLCVVASARNPEFSPGLVDRFLIAASIEEIPAVLCVNKIDLEGQSDAPWQMYREIGCEVFETSAKRGLGLDVIRERLSGKRGAFCGHSGVGKTSLLGALLGSDSGKIGEISDSTGKGRHTTTGAILLQGPASSLWIDTPGVREFGLAELSPEDLHLHFPELQSLGCAQESCLHLDEEGCAARQLLRYESYRRIYASLKAGEK